MVAAAEEAYANLDLTRAHELSTDALDSGRQTRDATARLYELLGTTSALSNEADASFDAYRRMLAIDPQRERDTSLSPALRLPFLRARGWWSSQNARFGAQLLTVADSGDGDFRFVIQLNDPLNMVDHVVLRVSTPHGVSEHEVPASGRVSVSLSEVGFSSEQVENTPEFQYSLEVLDARRNELGQWGSEQEPLTVANPHARVDLRAASGTGSSGPEVWEEWWFWLIIGAVVAGGAAVGAYFAVPPARNGLFQVGFR